ncbi:transmembrane protein Pmi [Brevipalpus obovatus]|uniref:transmembrane protein Pmi n=1 Tax=Brevipalpus obovatus TaxID=246614 RepID=UPI003D9DF3C2
MPSDDPAKCIIIREISDPNAFEISENELEKALERGCNRIIIEPKKLSDETSTWIHVGEFLVTTSMISGFGSIVSSLLWPKRFYTYVPLATISLFSSTVHHKLWEADPCSNYRVETFTKDNLAGLEPSKLSSSSVVLIKRSQLFQDRLVLIRTAISLLAAAFTAWRIFSYFRSSTPWW